jgi:predicted transcriptional regulator
MMRVTEIMSSPVVTVHPWATVHSTAELLATHGYTA